MNSRFPSLIRSLTILLGISPVYAETNKNVNAATPALPATQPTVS